MPEIVKAGEGTTVTVTPAEVPAEGFKIFDRTVEAPAAPSEQEQGAAPPPAAEAVAPKEGERPAAGDKEAPAAADPLTRSYEDLARRDRELQQRYAKIRESEAQLQKAGELAERLRTDPLGVLKDHGHNFYDLADQVLNSGSSEKHSAAEVPTAVKQEIEELKQFKQQWLADRYRSDNVQKINRVLAEASDKYPLVSQIARDDASIYDTILRSAIEQERQTGRQPSYNELLEQAEQNCEKNIFAFYERFGKIDKVRNQVSQLFASNQTPAANQTPKAAPTKNKQPQTLSNTMTGEAKTEVKLLTAREADEEFKRIMRERGWHKESDQP